MKEKENEKGRFSILGWLPAIIFIGLGLFVCLFLYGYSFSGYILIALGALAGCYQVIRLLRRQHLSLSKALNLIVTSCLILGLIAVSVTGAAVLNASLGDIGKNCDYVIVLGAGVNGTTPSTILRERIERAYTYLTENPDVICIASGGQGPDEDISEAQCIFDYLVLKGIDPDRIWLEDKSTSTEENFRFTLSLIEEKTGTRPAVLGVISNEFHLFRAKLWAQSCGVTGIGIPATTAWPTLRLNYTLREIAGVWYFLVFGG